jgi:hypothetical protein
MARASFDFDVIGGPAPLRPQDRRGAAPAAPQTSDASDSEQPDEGNLARSNSQPTETPR